jgi:hypothetical protein
LSDEGNPGLPRRKTRFFPKISSLPESGKGFPETKILLPEFGRRLKTKKYLSPRRGEAFK